MGKRVKFACLSDIHVPHHDPEAIEWALGHIKEHKPDVVVMNGDLFDANAASRHPNEFLHVLKQEYTQGGEILRALRGVAKRGAKCVFVAGNHDQNIVAENRIARDVRDFVDWRDPRIFPEIEHWDVREYISQPHRCCFRLGQVRFLHGFAAGKNSDNQECGQYGEFFGLVVRGHTHRPTEDIQQCVLGGVKLPIWYANTGTLTSMKNLPTYVHRCNTSSWGQGLLLGEAEDLNSPRHKRRWNAEMLIREKAWGGEVRKWSRVI